MYDQKGILVRAWTRYMNATYPLHGEALALLQILNRYRERMANRDTNMTHIFSDWSTLVKAVNHSSIKDLPSWSAAPTVGQCAQLVHSYKEVIAVRHVSRQALKDPHNLANWARRAKQPTITLSELQIDTHHEVSRVVDPNLFQSVALYVRNLLTKCCSLRSC